MPHFIEAVVRMRTPEDGGREVPVVDATGVYAPHLQVNAGELLGVRVVAGPEVLRPGEDLKIRLELIYPGVDYSVLNPGVRFEIVEGPSIVGDGTVNRRWTEVAGFETVFGSDIVHDGCFIELRRSTSEGVEPVLEVFRSDETGAMIFSCYAPIELPLTEVEQFIKSAVERLAPNESQSPGDTA